MSRNVRAIEALRAAWGATLLLAPRTVLAAADHDRVDPAGVAVARVLGARHLTQAALSGISPSPQVLAMGVWVDTVHAATAVGLAFADRSRARAALVDAGVASLWAVAGARDLEHASATAPAHDRRRDQLARTVLGVVPGGGPLRRAARRRSGPVSDNADAATPRRGTGRRRQADGRPVVVGSVRGSSDARAANRRTAASRVRAE